MNKNLIEESQMRAKWQANKVRMNNIAKALDYMYYHQKGHMLAKIDKMYKTGEKRELMKNYLQMSRYSGYTTDQLSRTFKPGVSIELKSDTISEENISLDQDKLVALCKKADLKPKLIATDKYVEMVQDSFIHAVWDEDEQATRLDIVPASTCFVEQKPNNPTAIKAFYYNIGVLEDTHNVANRVDVFQKITKEEYVEVTVSDNGKIVELNETRKPNPYGVIPVYHFFKSVQVNSYFSPEKSPILTMNESLNVSNTNAEITNERQGYALGVWKGCRPPKEFKVSQATQVSVVQDGGAADGTDNSDFKFVSPNINLEMIQKVQKNKELEYANKLGIPSSLYDNDQASFSSGYQLWLAMSGINEGIEKKVEFYDTPVQGLVEMIAKQYSLHGTDITFDNYEIVTKINPPKFESSKAEQLKNDDIELAQGKVSIIDILMRDFGFDRAKAEEWLARVKADNATTVVVPEVDLEV